MSTLIQIFAKAAVLGQVKTRLAHEVGAVAALEIHRRLCRKVVEQARAAKADAVEIWAALDAADPFLHSFQLPVHEQQGRELGTRMDFALRHGLARYQRVILIGADAYSLHATYLQNALLSLQNCDVVIGPALDGGYVLVGARKSSPAIFRDIPWGTSDVMAATLDVMLEKMMSFELLAERWDIDTLADIHHHAPELLHGLDQLRD